MFKICILLVTVFVFTSCNTLSEKECANVDWYRKGKMDAYEAKPKNSFGKLRESCEYYGFKANKNKYVRGYKSGVNTFCSEKGGMVYGATGKAYKNDCPEESELEFLRGYNQGRAGFNLDEINKKLEAQGKDSDDVDVNLSL